MFRVGLILASPQRRPMKQVDTLGIEPRASRMLSGLLIWSQTRCHCAIAPIITGAAKCNCKKSPEVYLLSR